MHKSYTHNDVHRLKLIVYNSGKDEGSWGGTRKQKQFVNYELVVVTWVSVSGVH